MSSYDPKAGGIAPGSSYRVNPDDDRLMDIPGASKNATLGLMGLLDTLAQETENLSDSLVTHAERLNCIRLQEDSDKATATEVPPARSAAAGVVAMVIGRMRYLSEMVDDLTRKIDL